MRNDLKSSNFLPFFGPQRGVIIVRRRAILHLSKRNLCLSLCHNFLTYHSQCTFTRYICLLVIFCSFSPKSAYSSMCRHSHLSHFPPFRRFSHRCRKSSRQCDMAIMNFWLCLLVWPMLQPHFNKKWMTSFENNLEIFLYIRRTW